MAKKKEKVWSVEKHTRCVWFKVYAEHVGFTSSAGNAVAGNTQDYPQQIAHLNAFLASLSSFGSNTSYNYHAILHDACRLAPRDDATFWNPDIEKPHVHLLISSVNLFRLSSLLNSLYKYCNLYYRPSEDTEMFRNATKFPDMRKKEHIRAIVYHTHETDDAVKDGKPLYDRSLCYTNIDNIDDIYNTYFTQLSHAKPATPEKYDIVLQARNIGRAGLSFDDFWNNDVPLNCRHMALKKECEDAYAYGINELLLSSDSKSHCRCSIFIQGDANLGKTYGSKLVFEQLGLKTYVVEAGGTGKMDDLDATYKAMVVSDTGVKDILGMADNDFCKVYRRGSGNPIWAGDYFVITYNGSLMDYIRCYTRIQDPAAVKALCSRFYECILTPEKGLVCISPQSRGDRDSLLAHNDMFFRFATHFNSNFFKYINNRPDSDSAEDLFKQQAAAAGVAYDPDIHEGFSRSDIRVSVPAPAPITPPPVVTPAPITPPPAPVTPPPTPRQFSSGRNY